MRKPFLRNSAWRTVDRRRHLSVLPRLETKKRKASRVTGSGEASATAPKARNVAVGDAIISLTEEIRMTREQRIAQSSKKTVQEQVVQVLEENCTKRMDEGAFIDAIEVIEDPGKARIFLTLKNPRHRECAAGRWRFSETQ